MEESYSGQYPLRRRDDPEHKEPDEDNTDEEEEDDDEEEGAVGVAASPGAAAAVAALQEQLGAASRSQRLARVINSPMFRVGDNMMIAVDMMDGARSQPEGKEKDKPAPSRDPERLRMIQERCAILFSLQSMSLYPRSFQSPSPHCRCDN